MSAAWDRLLERIGTWSERFENITFANSLGAEDVLLTELLSRHYPGVDIFCLDTGRLPEETLLLMEQMEDRFSRKFRVLTPNFEELEELVSDQGINGFYHGIEQRQRCCAVRKLAPLKRALQGYDAWITGLRSGQSSERAELSLEHWDDAWGLHKLNPLCDLTEADVWGEIRARGIPYNPLHDLGYPSIGCAPCTRAVQPGEDIRAGRWWWEQGGERECGLHNRPR